MSELCVATSFLSGIADHGTFDGIFLGTLVTADMEEGRAPTLEEVRALVRHIKDGRHGNPHGVACSWSWSASFFVVAGERMTQTLLSRSRSMRGTETVP